VLGLSVASVNSGEMPSWNSAFPYRESIESNYEKKVFMSLQNKELGLEGSVYVHFDVLQSLFGISTGSTFRSRQSQWPNNRTGIFKPKAQYFRLIKLVICLCR
jgi:hypothetical protein